MDNLLELHDRRMKLQEEWKANPPPDGFKRCDGYEGCGALTKVAVEGEWTCEGCGRLTLAVFAKGEF